MTFSLSVAGGRPGSGVSGYRTGWAGRRGRALAVAAGVFCAAGITPVALSVPAHAQGTCTTSGSTTTCTFAFTGAEQTFTVPNGVTQVDVTAIGAAGGLEGLGHASGGRGAQVSGTLTGLSGGQTLYVEVGGTATNNGSCYPTSQCTGGFNGGGNTHFGGGGGGASDIRTQPRTVPLTTTDSRLVVAAGGGGAGEAAQNPCPGSPGGDAGQPGADGACSGGTGGGAGTATQGGAGGAGGGGTPSGTPGTLGTGGNGGLNTGGGGGAGFYGGGGGGNINPSTSPAGSGGGGGGGSSLVPVGGTGPTVTSAAASITISYISQPTVTTTLTTSPNPSLFGHPVTLTDTVCPNGGTGPTPTGTVTFTDAGATLGTAPLSPGGGDHCAQAQLTWSNLLPGSHTLTAQYSGDTTYPAPALESATQTVNCTRTVTGSVASVIATGESTCVLGATVGGSVSAGAGTALFIGNSTVQGSVFSFGSTLVGVCGTTVTGSLAVGGASRFVVIGDPGDDHCAANQIQSSVRLSNNTGGLEAVGNHIGGSLMVTGNTGTGPFPEDNRPEIEGNTIGGSLACFGNTPPPTNDGHPNTVTGVRGGQCSTL
ncbi:Ig-like domain-containing protein [Kitasatospora sp. NPDC101155]|uniref:Ig-like domain-containing protein n=1 Tax=Kitasatospora sp. NPDC101155 TaxID=3364097 RepID=UPI0037F450E4